MMFFSPYYSSGDGEVGTVDNSGAPASIYHITPGIAFRPAQKVLRAAWDDVCLDLVVPPAVS